MWYVVIVQLLKTLTEVTWKEGKALIGVMIPVSESYEETIPTKTA